LLSVCGDLDRLYIYNNTVKIIHVINNVGNNVTILDGNINEKISTLVLNNVFVEPTFSICIKQIRYMCALTNTKCKFINGTVFNILDINYTNTTLLDFEAEFPFIKTCMINRLGLSSESRDYLPLDLTDCLINNLYLDYEQINTHTFIKCPKILGTLIINPIFALPQIYIMDKKIAEILTMQIFNNIEYNSSLKNLKILVSDYRLSCAIYFFNILENYLNIETITIVYPEIIYEFNIIDEQHKCSLIETKFLTHLEFLRFLTIGETPIVSGSYYQLKRWIISRNVISELFINVYGVKRYNEEQGFFI